MPQRAQRGMTLVEMMIAMVIGLVIVIAMSSLFVGSSASRREIQASAEASENGRYALDLLGKELAMAGFYGSLANGAAGFTAVPTGALDPCANSASGWKSTLLLHVVGYNQTDTLASCLTGLATPPKANTDVIFIQRAATCAVGDTGCGAEVATEGYLQIQECGTDYTSTPFELDQGGASSFTLKTKTCVTGTTAPKRKFIRRVYYVDGNNTLSYVDINLGGVGTPVTLVENIEQMQIEYGADRLRSDGSPGIDGTPDYFFSRCPDASGLTAAYTQAQCNALWSTVVGARVYLVARSTDSSRNTTNQSTFLIGDYTFSVNATTPNMSAKRRVYQTYIPFLSPKARNES